MSTIDGGHYHPLYQAGRAVRPDAYDQHPCDGERSEMDGACVPLTLGAALVSMHAVFVTAIAAAIWQMILPYRIAGLNSVADLNQD